MSLRLALLNRFLRLLVKPRLARMRDPDEARRHTERAARFVFRTPPFSLFRPVKLTGGTSALWIANRPARLTKSRRHQCFYSFPQASFCAMTTAGWQSNCAPPGAGNRGRMGRHAARLGLV